MREMNSAMNNRNSRARFKQRIIGGAVLVLILAAFLPFILKHAHPTATLNAPQNAAPQPAATPASASDQAVATPTALDQTAPAPEQQTETAAPAAAIPVSQTAVSPQPDLASQTQSATAVPSVDAPAQPSNQPELTPAQPESTVSQAQPSVASAEPVSSSPQAHFSRRIAAVHSPLPLHQVAGHWVVQVGSFTQADYAHRLAVQLRAHGLPVYTQRSPDQVTRVYVGPLASRQQAHEMQEKVQAEFQLNGLVRQQKA
jgi:DedD protein